MSILSPETPLIILEEEASLRLDVLLQKRFPHYSRTYFQDLIEKGEVLVNQERIKKREKLKAGDSLSVTFKDKEPSSLIPQKMDFDILYEDEYLVVINKPRGLVVHPAPGHPDNTVANGLLHLLSHDWEETSLRPGIVHRLDKDTSGVLLLAKTPQIHTLLSDAFKQREVHKEYLAICVGHPGSRKVQNILGRDPHDRKKFTARDEGKEAISEIETLFFKEGFSLVKILPTTGRTHQIRVHLQGLGTPVLGDPLYGSERVNHRLNQQAQMLHAHILKLEHPINKKELVLQAPLPLDMVEMQKTLFHKVFMQ